LTFVPLSRNVARGFLGVMAVVVDERSWGKRPGGFDMDSGPRIRVISGSGGNAPVRENRGTVCDRGRRPVGAESGAVTVVEDIAVLACDAPLTPSVPDDNVSGEVTSDGAPLTLAKIALSPPVGPVPLYGSANTLYPCITCGL
jgi:hypothetical protein